MFTIAPTSIPTIPLTLHINWNGPEIAGISTNSLTLHDMSPQPVIVTGVSSSAVHDISYMLFEVLLTFIGWRNPSNISEDRTSSLLIHVVSGVQAYTGISTSVSVVNKDIHWPQCIVIRPYTVPLLGGNITLYGMLVDICVIALLCEEKLMMS